MTPLSPKFRMPDMGRYTGRGCPRTHLRIYSQLMRGMGLDEAQLIMLFPLSLSSVAHSWFSTLDADEYLKYSFYPYDLVSFSSVFMLNKCPNALKVHSYDQVIHLVELCKIGGKTATKATGEATEF